MYKGSICAIGMAFILFLSGAVSAQDKVGKKLKDEVEQSVKSAKVLREIMGTPDKEIPEDLLARAECVAVFPSVIKAGFIFGGRGGGGGASFRTRARGGAPAVFYIGGGSVGLSIWGGAPGRAFVCLCSA